MKFQIKVKQYLRNIFKMGTLCVTFLVVSCSSDALKEENKDGNLEDNKGDIPAPQIDLLSKLSSFEVPITGTAPTTITEIANSAYNSPTSPYGMMAVIDFVVNIDNTIDVLWVGKTKQKHLMRISLDSKAVVKDFVIPQKASVGNSIGFDSLGNDKFVIGFYKDNSFGDKEAEAWYVAFDGNSGSEIFSTRIFGETSLEKKGYKGNPGQAGSALVKYNTQTNVIAIYLSHRERRSDNKVHQAGWLGFLDGTTGEILTNGTKMIGNSWYYSHNFDQRGMFSKDGKFYVLAHGDAYPRSLGFGKFSSTKGSEGGLEYYKIKNGAIGDNITNAHTGDLEELSDGSVAIVFSTSDDRSKRDLKLVILNALEASKQVISNELWLTKNEGAEYVGWASKVVQYGDKILIGWNTFDGKKPLNTKFCLADLKGNLIGNEVTLPKVVLYPTQSIKKTKDGKNVVFVSYNGANKLVVNVLKTE